MRIIHCLVFVLISGVAFAQSAFMPLNNDMYHYIDRYEILNGKMNQSFHTSSKPYRRDRIVRFVEESDTAGSVNKKYFIQDNWEFAKDSVSSKKPVLKHFYKNPASFYSVKTNDFNLTVNPVISLQSGMDTEADLTTFINTRGIQLRGQIDKKISFYSFLAENQMTMPTHAQEFNSLYSAVPGEAFWKTFKTQGVDFFTARGFVNFDATKNIHVQFGHDKNFIGNGYRSLILSDNAPSYLFLKLKTNVWKLNYTNIFAQMNADVITNGAGVPLSGLYPKKHVAFHHLSVNVSDNFNFGLFESIAYYRDSTTSQTFDINYMNPLIFYRSVEQNLGSQDNALLGLDFKWNFKKHLSLYGQAVLDEFLLSEVKAGNGWWANKQSGQLGLKYINAFGVENLDLQGEMNIIRPYMYTHNIKESSYSHYNQSLAHPLGGNLMEFLGIARYRPSEKLFFSGKLFIVKYGLDTASSNWGGNILLPNTTKEQNYGNTIAQGVEATIITADFTATYMIKHNLFVDLKAMMRRQDATVDALDRNTIFASLQFRWNIAQRLFEF